MCVSVRVCTGMCVCKLNTATALARYMYQWTSVVNVLTACFRVALYNYI